MAAHPPPSHHSKPSTAIHRDDAATSRNFRRQTDRQTDSPHSDQVVHIVSTDNPDHFGDPPKTDPSPPEIFTPKRSAQPRRPPAAPHQRSRPSSRAKGQAAKAEGQAPKVKADQQGPKAKQRRPSSKGRRPSSGFQRPSGTGCRRPHRGVPGGSAPRADIREGPVRAFRGHRPPPWRW